LKITKFMANKSQLMWQKGHVIKTKNHIVVDMCIGVPVFLRHNAHLKPAVGRVKCVSAYIHADNF